VSLPAARAAVDLDRKPWRALACTRCQVRSGTAGQQAERAVGIKAEAGHPSLPRVSADAQLRYEQTKFTA